MKENVSGCFFLNTVYTVALASIDHSLSSLVPMRMLRPPSFPSVYRRHRSLSSLPLIPELKQ